jgi:hypothetical protein
MNIAMEKRLARAEELLLPKELPKMRILFEPGPDADAETLATHGADLADAQSKGEQVILICAGKPRKNLPGMRWVNHKWEADLAVLASQPSERGNKSLLDDVFQDMPGNVLGVSKVTVDLPGDGEE